MAEKTIGEVLAELRGDKTQREVAEDLGITTSAVSMYENGERVPRDEIKMRIAKYYGKTVGDIFFKQEVHLK